MIKSIVRRENDTNGILDKQCSANISQGTIRDLRDTFKAQANMCVGLAAPQIGIAERVIAIIDIEKGKEKHFPLIMVNPVILSTSGQFIPSIEGCMSMERGKEWVMMRASEVKVSYRDDQNKLKVKSFKGLQARVIQHECDHLNGKCIDKIGKPVEINK